MTRAWLVASIVIALGMVGYFSVVRHVAASVVLPLGCIVPVLGGAVAAYLAPRNKFSAGAWTIIPAVLLLGVGGYIGGMLGFGDAIGAKWTVIAMVLTWPIIAFCSIVGAALGEWASRGSTNA